MDIPWFQRFLGKMDPFHIKFGLEGNGALEPWKFHGIECQTSNIGFRKTAICGAALSKKPYKICNIIIIINNNKALFGNCWFASTTCRTHVSLYVCYAVLFVDVDVLRYGSRLRLYPFPSRHPFLRRYPFLR